MNSDRDKFIEIFNSIDFQKISDHPNILIAARFWDEERYNAAKTCYKIMRAIDDLIDNYKAENKLIAPEERKMFTARVNEWLTMMTLTTVDSFAGKDLVETIQKFRIPFWLMEAFAQSMIYDIENDGFPSLDSFLDYARGASVAPASVFVHLAGIKKLNGIYNEPRFDVREAALPCAFFSYLVHIIRDFQKDQLNNLSYFPDDMMIRNGLNRQNLKDIAHGYPVNIHFRNLIRELLSCADDYRLKTLVAIEKIRPFLEPRYQLSLEIIFELYLLAFEKIDPGKGNFTTEELNPTPEETRKRVFKTIMNFTS